MRLARTLAFAASMTLASCGDQAGTPTSPRAEAGTIVAAKAPPPPTTVNVTSTLYDMDASGATVLTRSDDFNEAASASYTGINNISSHIGTTGNWQLYLGSQSARTIRLTLGSQGIPVPDGNYSSNVEVYTGCFDANTLPVSMLAMTAGTVNGNCSFGVDFSSGRTKYKLVMSPKYAGTGRAVVTCTSVAGANCASWTIATDTTIANARVANLYHYANSGALVLDGVYHNSFSVSVAP